MKLLVTIIVFLPWWMTPVMAYLGDVSGRTALLHMALLFYCLWPPCAAVLALILFARNKENA